MRVLWSASAHTLLGMRCVHPKRQLRHELLRMRTAHPVTLTRQPARHRQPRHEHGGRQQRGGEKDAGPPSRSYSGPASADPATTPNPKLSPE